MASPSTGGPDRLAGQADAAPAAASSPAAARLLALGVRRDVAYALGERPVAQVERVITQARTKSGVRDLAGWVVAALRNLPAEEPAAPPPPKVSDLAILAHPGLTNAERERWLRRFRTADPADRPPSSPAFIRSTPMTQPNLPSDLAAERATQGAILLARRAPTP